MARVHVLARSGVWRRRRSSRATPATFAPYVRMAPPKGAPFACVSKATIRVNRPQIRLMSRHLHAVAY
jgi:hypothetical protein